MKKWSVEVAADKKEIAVGLVKKLVKMSNNELNEKLMYWGLCDYMNGRKIDKIVMLMDNELMKDLSYEELLAYDKVAKVSIEICV